MVPLLDPLGVVGMETVSGACMTTAIELDHEETTLMWVTHRTLVLTLYVPAAVQDLDWVTESQAERSVASPFQSNWYSTVCRMFEVAPPVV